MIKEFEGDKPKLHEKTYLAEGAKVVGNVELEEYASLWHNVVARGDINRIFVGRYSNIQDNSVLHVADDLECYVGEFVTVGHGVMLHGCRVEDHCLIGMGSVLLNGVVVGRGSIIAAGAVIKEGMIIPPFSLVAGVPAKIIRELPEDLDKIHAQALKYKTLWTERYKILPDADGERYQGQEIV